MRTRSEFERLVIVEVKRRLVGFSVDAVGGVWSFEEKLLQAAPDIVLSKMIGRFVLGVVQRGSGLVVLLSSSEVVRVRKVERGGERDGPVSGVSQV
jgi:chemotaxis signal transduction protein